MKTLCIGVAGGTGSGKTTVTSELVRRVGAERIVTISQDRYYRDLAHLDDSQRRQNNFDHPNAVEVQLLVDHLRLLKRGQPATLPIYDFTRHVRSRKTERALPQPIILLEGILILAIPAIRELLDIKIFVSTDADIRLLRRLQRDIEERGRTVDSVADQYLATVRPMHEEFVEPSKRWADVIIPEGGYNTVALDLVISRILQMLQSVEN